MFALAAKAGVAPLYALPLVGLGAALLAVPLAMLLFRLRGAYFAISSWVVAEVFRLGAVLIVPLGGGSGMSLPVQAAKTLGRTPHERYRPALCDLAGAAGCWCWRRSFSRCARGSGWR